MKGYVNVDIYPWGGVDRVMNLERPPWDFEDSSVGEVRAIHIIEHLGKLTKVEILAELARICKPGAKVLISVPCATHRTALQSIQHAHTFYFHSFLPSYAQPYFYIRKMVCTVFGVRVPFVTPFHRLLRILGYFKMVELLEWELERHNEDKRWASAAGTPDEIIEKRD